MCFLLTGNMQNITIPLSCLVLHRFFFFLICLVIFACAGSLLLHRLFSSFDKWGMLSSCGAQASGCHVFSLCRPRALGHVGCNSVACGLSSCISWTLEYRLNSVVLGGLGSPWHVRPSWIRYQTCVSFGRWIPYH